MSSRWERAAALSLAIGIPTLLASCTTPCEVEVTPPVEEDFSSLRLDGNYRCDLPEGCEVRVEGTNRATVTIADGMAGAADITYEVSYGPTRPQKQKVTGGIELGGAQANKACATTHRYRWETWTVPTVTLTAVLAMRNGQPLSLTSSERILHLPSSTFSKLLVQTHYVDRANRDSYVGVLTQSEAFSSWTMAITRTGARFFIGPL